MKITDYFKDVKRSLISFEILPPLKGKSIQSLYDILDPLMEMKPAFIDVTYHREEYEYKRMPSGYYEKIARRKRPGTVGICAAIRYKYNVEAVPHFICGGFTKEETENALIDLNFLGVNNILALRGDARKMEKTFVPEPGGHSYAIDLVKQLNDMNHGRYLDPDLVRAVNTDFCIGVAAYPEKHFEASNFNADIQFLKAKIDAGADYVVTQMFFDNAKYHAFEKACRDAGITVPIIPGIKPITRESQLTMIPSVFHVDIPEDLEKAVRKAKTPEAVKEVGIEWCTEQSKDLFKTGSPCLHYYTMGDVETIRRIVEQVM